jgi:uncharacterized protein YjdB
MKNSIFLLFILCWWSIGVRGQCSIAGPGDVCVGATISLSTPDCSGPYSWSSDNTSIASINATTGLVTGISMGSTIITCTSASGDVTKAIVVNAPPPEAIIDGNDHTCVGMSFTLSILNTSDYAPLGGGASWSSSNTSIASLSSLSPFSRQVNGLSAGTAIITVTATNRCGASYGTKTVAINPLPTISSNPISICNGESGSLTASGGITYTWAPDINLSATTGSSVIVTSTTTATYTITGTDANGCVNDASATVTIDNPPPAAIIEGVGTLCQGMSLTLSIINTSDFGPLGGGTSWNSSNTSIASLSPWSPFSRQVNGISEGTTTITVTATNRCGSSYGTKTVTIMPLPTISGSSITICNGSSGTLTASGGITYSWNPATGLSATTGSSVTASPTVTTTYTITGTNSNGCSSTATATVNVNNVPVLAGITGTLTVCAGSNTTLSNSTPDGTWSSATPAVASVNSSTGAVYGVTGGSSTISYGASNSCGTSYATVVMTVNPLPVVDNITGADNFCKGAVPITYSCATSGGIWSITCTPANTLAISSGGSVTIGSVSSTAPASAIIQYAVTNSCGTTSVSKNIYAKGFGTILGSGGLCTVGSHTYTGSPSGGTWEYSSGYYSSVYTTSTSGAAVTVYGTGVTSSGEYLHYRAPNNANYCDVPYANVPFNIVSSAITLTGPSSVGVSDAPVTWTASSAGSFFGTWTSSNTAIASITTPGTNNIKSIDGVAAGTATISFTGGATCPVTVTRDITVTSPRYNNNTGVNGIDEIANEIEIYPNPSTDRFTVVLPRNIVVTVTVLDINGKKVASKPASSEKVDFDFHDFPRGFYVVEINAESKKYIRQILIN